MVGLQLSYYPQKHSEITRLRKDTHKINITSLLATNKFFGATGVQKWKITHRIKA